LILNARRRFATMRPGYFASALLAATFILATPAGAAVSVTFVAPESYSDASTYGRYRGPASASLLRDLEAHIVKLGARYLPTAQTLKIEVLDIDLAGEYEPFRVYLYDVRVLRGVTWPRIKLRYVLQQNGVVLRESEELVADQAYLMGVPRLGNTDRLYYEKRMLEDWFRQRFAEKRAAQ
jgi:hypothetical protein